MKIFTFKILPDFIALTEEIRFIAQSEKNARRIQDIGALKGTDEYSPTDACRSHHEGSIHGHILQARHGDREL